MDSSKDKRCILTQISELKSYSSKIQECLSAIQLLAVDDNNSRVKSDFLKDDFKNLSKQIDSINSTISSIEKNLN